MRKWMAFFLALWMLLLAGCTQGSEQTPHEQTTETVEQTPSEQTDAALQPTGELTLPEEDFLSASYITERPDGANLIAADERGELILLETSKELTNIWISRVEFDDELKDYVRTERLWWQSKWEPGSKLVLQMNITKDEPAMELSWEDEFGQRERRLIDFERVFYNGMHTETVSLLYFISPLRPTDLSALDEYYYDMDADGNKEIIRFTRPEQSAGDEQMAALKITKGSTVFEYHVLLASGCKCYLADLDGDYQGEIYLSGTTAEERKLTYALQLSDVGIVPMDLENPSEDADHNPVLLGEIEKLEPRILYLTDTVYVFSRPYTGHASYGYTNHQLQSVSGVWTLDEGRTAFVKLGVPMVDEDGDAQTLAIGTGVQPIESDLTTFVKIKTTDGKVGTVSISVDEDGDWIIGGHYDTDLFTA